MVTGVYKAVLKQLKLKLKQLTICRLLFPGQHDMTGKTPEKRGIPGGLVKADTAGICL